jgi:hypothetical protein
MFIHVGAGGSLFDHLKITLGGQYRHRAHH